MSGFIVRHKTSTAVAALFLGVATWLAFGYFEVQAAFIDDHVAEAAPAPVGDGMRRFVRFEQFATSNGPDLNVYLVKGPKATRTPASTSAT